MGHSPARVCRQCVDRCASHCTPASYTLAMHSTWTPAFSLDRIAPGTSRLYKQNGAQVAIFRLLDDTIFAVDNRCPHEGYPLTQGSVSGCTLTCKWHNYKFDLRDGACLVGEEGVRSYPVRVVDRIVELDLHAPASLIATLLADLEAATYRHEPGRIARNLVRLLDLGATPGDLAMTAARFDADHAEFGVTHVLALAAELVTEPTAQIEPALPLAQLFDLAGRANVRLGARVRPAAIEPTEDATATGEQLRRAVEGENAPLAEGILRGALAFGWRRTEIEPWFFQVCADHFLDFGHPLIYCAKIFDALDVEGWRSADSVLGGLVHGIVFATREDLLPAWSGWRRRLDTAPNAPLPELALAAAERLLRFDAAIDADAATMEGWLDVTHRLTFVHAVRRVVARWNHVDVRKLTLQAQQFVAMAAPLDGAAPLDAAAPPTPETESATLDAIVTAARTFQTTMAVALTRVYLDSEGAAGRRALALRAATTALENLAWQDHATRAVFLAHHIKTLRAARDEALDLDDDRPFLGAVRFVASRVRERNVERSVRNAIALVRHGKPPTTLT